MVFRSFVEEKTATFFPAFEAFTSCSCHPYQPSCRWLAQQQRFPLALASQLELASALALAVVVAFVVVVLVSWPFWLT